jgi:hypothetical protein
MLGRGLMTHEFASEALWEELRAATKDDFLAVVGDPQMDETPDAEFITHARTDIPALLKVAALVDEWIALSDELGRTTLADRKARSLFGKRDRAYWALRAAIAELEALP